VAPLCCAALALVAVSARMRALGVLLGVMFWAYGAWWAVYVLTSKFVLER
jgi:hypothetical protein